ncbi:hypothetical protein Efla_000613 [Eimeria flavescens]
MEEEKEEAEEPPSCAALSVGFWDAFAGGKQWKEPVLAVLSCSSVGKDHFLLLATDGSVRGEEGRRPSPSSSPPKQQQAAAEAAAAAAAEPGAAAAAAAEEAAHAGAAYQHGRLLLPSKSVPCKPESLLHRRVCLLVYAKERPTPLVTDLLLLPGLWLRPQKAFFVPHPLYARESSKNESGEKKKTTNTQGRRKAANGGSEEEAAVDTGRKRERTTGEEKGNNGKQKTPVYCRSRGGPVAKVQRGVQTALADLHLYSHHWEIVTRVSYKSPVRCFANAKGESSLFSVNLIDRQGTEIRATFFGRAVSLWFSKIEVGKVYTFSGGILQRANRTHNPLSHEVEIKFDATAQIEEAADDPSIPLQRFERVKLADISSLPVGSLVDVLAFVAEAKEPQTIISKTKNEELVRRELTLLDSSGVSVSLAAFGPQALQLPQSALAGSPLLAIKGARVNDYAGRACLSSTAQMQISLFSPLPSSASNEKAGVSLLPRGQAALSCGVCEDQLEAERRWWLSASKNEKTAAASRRTDSGAFQTLRQISEAADKMREEEAGSTKTFRATASVFDLLGGKFIWLACPTCKRKVQKELPSASTSNNYKCNKCRSAVIPERRWMLSLKLVDFSGSLNCVALGDQGQAIMDAVSQTAESLSQIEGGGVDTRGRTFADVLEQLTFCEFEFEFLVKCEMYKEEKTVQVMVRSASWVAADPSVGCMRNVKEIGSLLVEARRT